MWWPRIRRPMPSKKREAWTQAEGEGLVTMAVEVEAAPCDGGLKGAARSWGEAWADPSGPPAETSQCSVRTISSGPT